MKLVSTVIVICVLAVSGYYVLQKRLSPSYRHKYLSPRKEFYAKTHRVLSHDASIDYLRANGYRVGEISDGYQVTYKMPDYTIRILFRNRNGLQKKKIRNEDGDTVFTLIYERGKLCVAFPK